MDILGAYEKQNTQPVQAVPQRQLAPEYGFFIRLVIRLSGGRITNMRRASVILAASAGIIMFLSLIIFVLASPGDGGTPLPYEKTYHPTQPMQ